MPKMIALKRQSYNGHNISIGDVFDVSIHHVRILKALGRVADMTAVKAMTAENTKELVPISFRHVVVTESIMPVIQHVVVETVEETKPIVIENEEETAVEPPTIEIVPQHEEQQPLESILDKIDETTPELETQSLQEEESMPESVPTQTVEYSAILRNHARLLGIRVDGRWSDQRVQREIDEYNKRTYQRMDVRATE